MLEADKCKYPHPKESLKVFVKKCWMLPLCSDGLSLLDIRKLWKGRLRESGWITEDGSYNYPFICSQEQQAALNCLDTIAKNVVSEISDVYLNVVGQFKQSTARRFESLFESTMLPDRKPDPDTLLFFKKMAESIGLAHLEIEFFSRPNGPVAYLQGNKIFINLRTHTSLIGDIKKTYFENDKKWAPVMQRHAEALRHWISVLAHECAHAVESSECAVAHGPWFDSTWAAVIAQLMKNNPLKILDQIFNHESENTLKST